MNLEDTDELCTSYDGLETLMLECDLMIKKLGGGATPTLLSSGNTGVKLEGLSTSGEFYPEAITTLKNRYDRPRLILQSHVRAILEAPALKDGGGREIRRLHDTVQQHYGRSKQCPVHPLVLS